MEVDLLNSTFETPDDVTEPDLLPSVTETISLKEFKRLEKKLIQDQTDRLSKCRNIDGDWRCEKCGSSLWHSEVRFRLIDRMTKKPTGTHVAIKKVWYCINNSCEKAPPLVSSVGVIRPEQIVFEKEKEVQFI